MLERSWALQFAQEWIASWNAHDLDRILSHYTEDFEMSSPLIVERLGREDGVLKGKTAVAEYWKPSMSLEPPLRFELEDVLVGVNHLTIYYHNVGRKVVAETLTFDNALKVISGASQWSAMSSPWA
jgi:ketosteroid isomerase-like protein